METQYTFWSKSDHQLHVPKEEEPSPFPPKLSPDSRYVAYIYIYQFVILLLYSNTLIFSCCCCCFLMNFLVIIFFFSESVYCNSVDWQNHEFPIPDSFYDSAPLISNFYEDPLYASLNIGNNIPTDHQGDIYLIIYIHILKLDV